jgi:hypothetical protein
LVRDPHPGVVLNEHYDGDGAIIFREAPALSLRAFGCIVVSIIGSTSVERRRLH